MDILRQNRLRALVIENLAAIGGKQKGDHIWLNCPWHNESEPSLSVHIGHKIIPGSFNCFGCKAKGNWNTLAKRLNLPLFEFRSKSPQTLNPEIENGDDFLPIDIILKDIRAKMANEQMGYKTLKGIEDLPDGFSWRGYGKKFYDKLGGMFYWDRNFDRSYLYFPLYMNGTYVGYTICNLDGTDKKYQTFADTSKVFFLYDTIPHGVPIILVEGHFDALRLFADGFFPLGIFGVQNWSEIKKNYLLAKAPPKIIIAMDGDQAGYDAAIHIFKDLRVGCDVDIFYLPIYDKEHKIDPGNMPIEFIHQLQEKLHG